ncbi:multidrug ABC transporter ATP-binding protein [Cellulomonas bogoriensis 69B4 = DSM 16987]|uniref:Fatty acid ABC transporter ATP-binding/permease protein n=2 Tax=Cellulomonas bogoriensis TaxID=301388 RepID=A0A0A0BYK2_9CELL|nr:multidrug ABC transporter ATP-binding protein [Cellulomonas bogoriensis 69B4 = DSM 16987]
MSAAGPAGGRAAPLPMGPRSGGPHAVTPGAKPMEFGRSARRLLRSLAPERVAVAGGLVLTVLTVGLTALGPLVLGRATDVIFTGAVGQGLDPGLSRTQHVDALQDQGRTELADMLAAMPDVVPGQGVDTTRLGQVLLVALGLYLGAWAFGYLQGLVTTGLVQRTVNRLREQVEAKLGRLPLAHVDRQSRGDLLSRVSNDIDNLSQVLQQTLGQLVQAILTIIGVLAMMLWISPLLALIAVVTVPVAALVTAVIAKRAQPQFVEQWARTGTVNGHVEEMYTGHALVKVFGRQAHAARVMQEENDALYRATFRANVISGLIQPAMMFISNLNFVAIAVVGGLRVAAGAISLGDVQAFIQYSRQFTQPMTQVASMMNMLQSGVASAERVFEVLDGPEMSPEPTDPPVPSPLRGRVEFQDVRFRYRPDTPLIDGLHLVAEPGRTVAVVGPTGAGKTTLVNLLMRFYELDGGRITLDGVDIAQMDRRDLRRSIGMVLQDTWLFTGTIAENIAYGRQGATLDDVVEAARVSHVDRFVRTLPDGYDTVVEEDAGNLSAGEKQLITIARAFLADPTILVLDEATSSVDTRTEVLVQQAMAALRQRRTSFVIAHRLSTIRDADVILVMDRGAIVEQGSHAELLRAGGAYAELHASQFAAAVDPVD